MNHHDDPRITAYIFGELSADERSAFEAELQASPALRRTVAEIRQTLEILQKDLRDETPLSLTDQQRQLVHREMRRVSPSGDAGPVAAASRSVRPRWRRIAVGTAIAASLLIAFVWGAAWYAADGTRRVAQKPRGDSSRFMAVHNAASATQAVPEPSAPPAPRWDQLQDQLAAGTSRQNQTVGSLETRWTGDPAGPPVMNRPPAQAPPSSTTGVAPGSLAFSPEGRVLAGAVGPGSAAPGYAGGYGGAAPGYASGPALEETVRVREAITRATAEIPSARPDLGSGPGMGGDRYDRIEENPFVLVKNEPLSTFSIDVDTASYSKTRQYLLEHRQLPRPDAVRIEELINYFPYAYQPPSDQTPFAAHVEVAECPWTPRHRLVRVGIKGREIDRGRRPTSNLVFLLDVSGSMAQPNKLPLLKRGLKMLVDQLSENDRIAIVVYAGAAGLVLDSTTGDQKPVIMDALDRLQAGGSTNGGQGLQLAYQTALDHFVAGGVNRVILCTDGDFNVGVTGTDQLVRSAQQHAKSGIFLTVLGFGMGNHNDAMLEQVSNKGNGNYAFIDTDNEARKVLVEQLSGTLVAIAKDVKIQIEFNPQRVAAYRLIGYENRLLAAQDFNDDRKDAGEIGAGHTVTALYEIAPADGDAVPPVPEVDELRYQQRGQATAEAQSAELLTLKIRYKQPDGDSSTKLTFPVSDDGRRFGQATRDFRFAAAVASFGMLLRDSQHKGSATYAGVLEIATEGADGDPTGYRQEFPELVRAAMGLAGR